MKLLIVCAALMLLPLQLSAAGFDSGDHLRKSLRECTNDAGSRACFMGKGYVVGVSDATDNDLCKPAGVTKEQLVEVVLKWLNENPQDLHYIASYNIKTAISEAWPCS